MRERINRLLKFIAAGARLAVREPGVCLLVLRMAFWVVALVFLMKAFSLKRAVSIVAGARSGRAVKDARATKERLAQLLDAVLGLNVWVFTPTCWKRAPVLRRFLSLAGIESRVVFGVRRGVNGKLDGHAWLEAEGEPLLETDTPDYHPTFVYP